MLPSNKYWFVCWDLVYFETSSIFKTETSYACKGLNEVEVPLLFCFCLFVNILLAFD